VSEMTVDAVGRRCPMPVIELAKWIDEVEIGEVVVLVADDPAAAADVPAWCRMRGHEYVGERAEGDATAYVVRRSH
jgi:TusA-related sulfurtransferase